MIIDTNNGYVVAMQGLERADPHARFQYYVDAERFALAKSREFRDVSWTLTKLYTGHELGDRETFYRGKRIKGDLLTA